jgi:hypothetical protein
MCIRGSLAIRDPMTGATTSVASGCLSLHFGDKVCRKTVFLINTDSSILENLDFASRKEFLNSTKDVCVAQTQKFGTFHL